MTISADDLDRRNRATWAHVVDQYVGVEGWTDAGERSALAAVAPHVRGLPVLDIGVGAGRTTAFLRLLTDDYVAIDHTEEMVAAFRQVHPDVEVHVADARSLERFEDGRFGLVAFSYNGIDGLPHEDRATVLRELRRVARPDGWVFYSTHNLDGPSYGEVPWRGRGRAGPLPLRLARWLAAAVRDRHDHRRRWRGWWAGRSAGQRGDGWAVRVSAAHGFGVLMHYATAEAVVDEALRAGLVEPVLFASESGRRIDPDEVSSASWFQVLARAH